MSNQPLDDRAPARYDYQHAPVAGQVSPYGQPAQAPTRHGGRAAGLRLTAAEAFWYVLGNIALGGMYFAKVPVKKALEEAGLATMTGAERFWYVLMCIGFGAGYFAKVPVKKALTECPQLGQLGQLL